MTSEVSSQPSRVQNDVARVGLGRATLTGRSVCALAYRYSASPGELFGRNRNKAWRPLE